MHDDLTPVASAGWSLALATAHAGDIPTGRVVLCRGEDADAPRRGFLALVTEGETAEPAAVETADLCGRLFAEGYFGAVATIGARRAAARALTSTNDWIRAHLAHDPARLGAAVSLTALLLPAGRRGHVLHLGADRLVLLRDGEIIPFTRPHRRRLPSGSEVLTRGLGIDPVPVAEAIDVDLRRGDRLLLLSANAADALDGVPLTDVASSNGTAAEAAAHLATRAGSGVVVVVDILDVPPAKVADIESDLEALAVGPPPHEGDLLDGYRMGRTLYRGKYTLLKRAHDTLADRDVVLKLPLPAMAQDTVFRAGFLREAWIGARVHSDRVIEYLDPGPDRRSRLYLVMPHYTGETLDDRLRRTPPVSLGEGVGIALALCEAIGDLARAQVVHRDIKPENVFLLRNGEIRLMDLGLAALSGLDDPDVDALGGTTRYMAPELFRGAQAGERSEIFSLAVTLYRMFAGGPFPFGRREARPLARARPDLPVWLGRVLARALAADPADRPPDVAALAADLQHGLVHEDWRGPAPGHSGLAGTAWRIAAIAFALIALALAVTRH